MTLERLFPKASLAHGQARKVTIRGHQIAVVRCEEDVFAVSDICSHQRISLSEGEVMCATKQIECWKHGSAFNLRTGRPDALPASRPIAVFEVSIRHDDVYVEVP